MSEPRTGWCKSCDEDDVDLAREDVCCICNDLGFREGRQDELTYDEAITIVSLAVRMLLPPSKD